LGASNQLLCGLGVRDQIAKVVREFSGRLQGDGAGTRATAHASQATHLQIQGLRTIAFACQQCVL
jgi:hypothetical protein